MSIIGKHKKLIEVKDSLSRDLLIPINSVGLIYFFRDLTIYLISLILIWNTNNLFLLIPLWMLSGLTIGGLFVLGHDAAHGALLKGKRLNWWIGQIAMLPSLHAFGQWAYGHNRIHHGHTVKLNSDFVWHPVTPDEYKKFNRFKKIWHQLSWSIIGAGPYYLIDIWFKGMVLYTAPTDEAKRDKRIINFWALAVFSSTLIFGGLQESSFSLSAGFWMVFKLLVVPFIIWNYVIGFTVYVQHINSEIPWKISKEWTPFYGQIEGTFNYKVPRWLNFFLHNIFIHSPHHVQMKIPFYKLPDALSQIKQNYSDSVKESSTIFKDYLRSTKACKLYDSSRQKWMSYSEGLKTTTSA